MTLRLMFRVREGLWWAQIASVTRIASGRDCGGQWWWARIPSVTRIASGRVVVGREGLLVFQAREVVVVGANLLRHSNHEREDGGKASQSRFERGRGW